MMMKRILILLLLSALVLPGCYSVFTPKHRQAVDLASENADAFYEIVKVGPITDDENAPVPADVLEYLEANRDSWEYMADIAHWRNPEE